MTDGLQPHPTTQSSSPIPLRSMGAASQGNAATNDLDSGTAIQPTPLADQAESSGPQGYQKLALLMGAFPDHAIFRRFGWLSTLNLMRLQAELARLEWESKKCQREDEESQSQRDLKRGQTYATSFGSFAPKQQNLGAKQLDPSSAPLDPVPKQLVLMWESASVLRKYNALLLQTAQIAALGRPGDEQSKDLGEWLQHSEGGNNFQTGVEMIGTWDTQHKLDFLGLVPDSGNNEEIARLLRPWVRSWYHWLFGRLPFREAEAHREKNLFAFGKETRAGRAGAVHDYSDSDFLATSRWSATAFLTAVCSLLPALMILWLNSVETTRTPIYITIGRS